MKSAITLISSGLLGLVIALGAWMLTRPPIEAGDAAAFEAALTESRRGPVPSVNPHFVATSPAGSPAPPAEEPPAPVPRFTVGQSEQVRRGRPTAIRIPALDQAAPIIAAGVEPNGDMEVPDNVTDVAWYKYGSAPGGPGSAVLAAHVDLAGQGPGVFFELGELAPGSVIYIDFDDGTTEAYRAAARAIYEKEDLPTEAIFSREGSPVLTLITCGGDFNRSIRRYESNVVVYAVPWDDASPEST